VKTGVQAIPNQLKTLDSGFRRNDKTWPKETFYETIKFKKKYFAFFNLHFALINK